MRCQVRYILLAGGCLGLLGAMCGVQGLAARELSAREQQCLAEIKAEVAFISSRIELIHREFEAQVDSAGLEAYRSGEYSTIALLDNSIRKYRLSLVEDLRTYPQRYRSALDNGRPQCLSEQLRYQGIGMLREFERNWSLALDKARHNADYFQRLERMNH